MPAGLSVRSTGSSVDVYGRGTSRHAGAGAELIEKEDGHTLGERVEGIAWYILNGAQDGVMDILTEQWPVGADGRAAEPGTRVEGDELRMWFGDARAPEIMLQPIPIGELFESAV
jgi:hypothetical protein